ncbi:MAG: hypothetical protein AUK44_05040 [Porphyromonadaceae bacterium CG2_30_38_12]|nr:MAG: hypothetical protein AUK44_05040 [Porphyromonadaceae bacterium CG2_30_38_12]
MNTKTFIASLFILAATISLSAQSNNFEKELSAWHKKAAITCGMIKSPEAAAKATVISQNLVELGTGLDLLAKNYKTNPHAAYKNDPLWASYFVDFADNLTVVNNFAGKQEYRVAAKNCSVFCQTVLRMHKNNGTVDLADMLFSFNMQLKLTTDMTNAGNFEMAKENLVMVKKIMEHASMKLKTSSAAIQAMYIPVEKNTQDWMMALEKGDAAAVKAQYVAFTPNFQKIFMASMD